MRDWLGIKREMTSLNITIKLIKKEYKGVLVMNKAIVLAFASTVYYVWRARNTIVFTSTTVDVFVVFGMIQMNITTFYFLCTLVMLLLSNLSCFVLGSMWWFVIWFCLMTFLALYAGVCPM